MKFFTKRRLAFLLVLLTIEAFHLFGPSCGFAQNTTVPGGTSGTIAQASATRSLYLPVINKPGTPAATVAPTPTATPKPFTEDMFRQKVPTMLGALGTHVSDIDLFLDDHTPQQKELILKVMVKSLDLLDDAYTQFRATDPQAPNPFRASLPLLTLISAPDMAGAATTYITDTTGSVVQIVVQVGTTLTTGELEHVVANESWHVAADTDAFGKFDPVMERAFAEGMSNILSRYVLKYGNQGSDADSRFSPDPDGVKLSNDIIQSEWGQSAPAGDMDPDSKVNDLQAAEIVSIFNSGAKMSQLIEHMGAIWSKEGLKQYTVSNPNDDMPIVAESMSYMAWQNSGHAYTPKQLNEWIVTENKLLGLDLIPPVRANMTSLKSDWPYMLVVLNSRLSGVINSNGVSIPGRLIEPTSFFTKTGQLVVKFFPDKAILSGAYRLPRPITFTRPNGTAFDIPADSPHIRIVTDPIQTNLVVHVADAATEGTHSEEGSQYTIGINFDWKGEQSGIDTQRSVVRTVRVNITGTGGTAARAFPMTSRKFVGAKEPIGNLEQLKELLKNK